MSGEDPRSDAQLLAATPGDPDAFAAFYRRHVSAVVKYVAAHARPGDVADVVAEVFATALVHRRRFDPVRGSGSAWLVGIARHKLADARRGGSVETKMCRRLGISPPQAEPQLDESDAILAGLPSDQRRAVEARVLADQTYAEIARREAISEQVARKRVSRALAALRSHFEEEQ